MTALISSRYVDLPNFKLSLEQYQQMIELGVLNESHKVELILGEIKEKMPITSEHAAGVRLVKRFFRQRYGESVEISSENPIALPNNSQPEPDCFIAVFREDFYAHRYPTPDDIHIVIEVAKSTLYTDRQIKMAMYAEAGIREFWIINLVESKIELHLSADTESATYASVTHYRRGKTFNSPFAGQVEVDALFPDDS